MALECTEWADPAEVEASGLTSVQGNRVVIEDNTWAVSRLTTVKTELSKGF